jgi:hypothetical protein
MIRRCSSAFVVGGQASSCSYALHLFSGMLHAIGRARLKGHINAGLCCSMLVALVGNPKP